MASPSELHVVIRGFGFVSSSKSVSSSSLVVHIMLARHLVSRAASRCTSARHLSAGARGKLLVDCSKVAVHADAYGGAGAFAAVDISKGDVVE